jgi:receptor protein-tyrosine kinase
MSNTGPDGKSPRDRDGELSIIEAVRRRQQAAQETRQKVAYPEHLRPCPDLILAHDPRHQRSEAIRALRTKLLLARDDSQQAGTFVVLSPTSGEGRSQLCAELAIAFAQLGRATLLVDADLRCPRQHALFGAHNQWGLAQALCEGEPPRLHGIQGVPDLALLTSGGTPTNPLELLSGDRFEHLVGVWQHDYEFIVIDTPPVTRYSDGLAIASVARRAIIVCRARSTSFKNLKEMTRHLAAAPTYVVGAVINRF